MRKSDKQRKGVSGGVAEFFDVLLNRLDAEGRNGLRLLDYTVYD